MLPACASSFGLWLSSVCSSLFPSFLFPLQSGLVFSFLLLSVSLLSSVCSPLFPAFLRLFPISYFLWLTVADSLCHGSFLVGLPFVRCVLIAPFSTPPLCLRLSFCACFDPNHSCWDAPSISPLFSFHSHSDRSPFPHPPPHPPLGSLAAQVASEQASARTRRRVAGCVDGRGGAAFGRI
jgi:hypothetical protein